MIELPKPQIGILTKTGGLVSSGIEDPKQSTFMFITIGSKKFRDYAQFEFGKHEPFRTGRSYWVDGMQSSIVNEVTIFTDDPDSGLFTLAYFLNDRKHPFMFAKMKGCPLTDQIMELFTR